MDNFDLNGYLKNNPLLKENFKKPIPESNNLDPKVKKWLKFQYETFLEGSEEAEDYEFEEDVYTDPEKYNKKDIEMFLKSRDKIKKLGKITLSAYGNKGTFTINNEGNILLHFSLI